MTGCKKKATLELTFTANVSITRTVTYEYCQEHAIAALNRNKTLTAIKAVA